MSAIRALWGQQWTRLPESAHRLARKSTATTGAWPEPTISARLPLNG
jgi:hypothetical protein